MIIGSAKTPFTMYGLLGYSALAGMVVDAVLIWKKRIGNNDNVLLPKSLHLHTVIAYTWWLLAYITGSLLIMLLNT